MTGEFETTVRALAARQGVRVTDVRLDPALGNRARGSALCGGRISYGPDLEAEGPAFTTWAAAHETAHVALGHGGVLTMRSERAVLLALFVAGVCALARSAVVAFTGEPGAGAWMGLGGLLMVCGGLVLVLRVSARLRAYEAAADQLAHSWGYPFTVALAQVVERQEGRLQRRTPIWLRDHPYPRDRVTAERG